MASKDVETFEPKKEKGGGGSLDMFFMPLQG
jgi:hypothetical protein